MNNTRSICSSSYAGHLATRLSRFGTLTHDPNGSLKVKEREFNPDPGHQWSLTLPRQWVMLTPYHAHLRDINGIDLIL
ncbi:hypothetical protein K443DRAFT_619026 [Laccaria amethystina LaAM-08-1]|uniref:Uncharacterized protein n=1 Tax=Laccaria amethystina LaAM-08-1 TaxID=1095629 RepID=A0A0C9WPP4_9AGAR|nr:hypothetical protein K443DRAFT_619026 [Laccaria amethystina LaAM-08-1]